MSNTVENPAAVSSQVEENKPNSQMGGRDRSLPAKLHHLLQMDLRADGSFTAMCGELVAASRLVPAGSADEAAARPCQPCQAMILEWHLRFEDWLEALEQLWDLEDVDGVLYVSDLGWAA